MKVTSVELHPASSSNVAVLSFQDPGRKNPYNVKGIDGLDAEEIVPRFYGGSGSTAKFYNLALASRDIVVRIGLNPRFHLSESYSGLRDALYKLVSSSRTGLLQIQFKNGLSVTAAISGFVTKVEAPHFEKNQEVLLTINCKDPMLRALDRVSVDVTSLDPALTIIDDALSTAPHGVIFVFEALGNVASLNITDPNDASWSFEATPVGGFLTGDLIHLSSEINNTYLRIVRGANTIHLADVITPGSVWPILFSGENSFSLANPTSFDWSSIEYYPTYWGV